MHRGHARRRFPQHQPLDRRHQLRGEPAAPTIGPPGPGQPCRATRPVRRHPPTCGADRHARCGGRIRQRHPVLHVLADHRQPVRRRSLRVAHRNRPPRSRRCDGRFHAGPANRWHPVTVPATSGDVKHKARPAQASRYTTPRPPTRSASTNDKPNTDDRIGQIPLKVTPQDLSAGHLLPSDRPAEQRRPDGRRRNGGGEQHREHRRPRRRVD